MIPQPRELKRYDMGGRTPKEAVRLAQMIHCKESPLPVTIGKPWQTREAWVEGLLGVLKTRGAEVAEGVDRPWVAREVPGVCAEIKPGEAVLSGPLCTLQLHTGEGDQAAETLAAVHIIREQRVRGTKEQFAWRVVEVHVPIFEHENPYTAADIMQGFIAVNSELNHGGYLVSAKMEREKVIFRRETVPVTIGVYTATLTRRWNEGTVVTPELFCDQGVMVHGMNFAEWARYAAREQNRHKLVTVAEHVKTAAALQEAPDNSSKREILKVLADRYSVAVHYARPGGEQDRFVWIADNVENKERGY